MALQRRLKAAFDPQNIMNPGKIFPDPPEGKVP
jgi:FAD/FMN-containing dehydrogenase